MKNLEKGIKIIGQLNYDRNSFCTPVADDINMSKVIGNTLYARESFYAENGSKVMAWTVILSMLVIILLLSYSLYAGGYEDYIDFVVIVTLVCILFFMLPFFIIWRSELPVCFNRKTRQVSFWKQGELFQENWDQLEFYRATKVINDGNGVLHDVPILFFKLVSNTSNKEISIRIRGTQFDSSGHLLSDFNSVEGVWKYLYLFMNEGKQSLPSIYFDKNTCSLLTSVKSHNPFSSFCRECDALDYTIGAILLPISIPFFFLAVPTDLIYCALDKILPRRPLPKALREACEAE